MNRIAKLFKSHQVPHWVDLLAIYLLPAFLFILLPLTLYIPNQSEWFFDLNLLVPFFILAIASLFFLGFFINRLSPKTRDAFVITSICFGFFFLVKDILSPLQILNVTGSMKDTIPEPIDLTLKEMALFLTIFAIAWKLPRLGVKRFAAAFTFSLILFQLVHSSFKITFRSPIIYSMNSSKSKPLEKTPVKGNVYHFIFDAFSSDLFLPLMEEMHSKQEFDGFTFFERNLVNYLRTEESLASFLTGTFNPKKGLKEWTTSYKSHGILANVSSAGYIISSYVTDDHWIHPKSTLFKTNNLMRKQIGALKRGLRFADFWFLRLVPNFLRQEVYSEGRGSFSRLFQDPFLSVNNHCKEWLFYTLKLLHQLIVDEKNRPKSGQYIYTHILFPHSPYVFNRQCQFIEKGTSLTEQTGCALQMMVEFVQTLKKLERYHDATIIFQSDHAEYELRPTVSYKMTPKIHHEIARTYFLNFPGKFVESRSQALLLIKPPSKSKIPLKVSQRLTQLLDLPASLYDLLGLRVQAPQGISVFSRDFPQKKGNSYLWRLRPEKAERSPGHSVWKKFFQRGNQPLFLLLDRGLESLSQYFCDMVGKDTPLIHLDSSGRIKAA